MRKIEHDAVGNQEQERHELLVDRLRSMTREEAFALAVEAGICDSNGVLTPYYRDDTSEARPTKTEDKTMSDNPDVDRVLESLLKSEDVSYVTQESAYDIVLDAFNAFVSEKDEHFAGQVWFKDELIEQTIVDVLFEAGPANTINATVTHHFDVSSRLPTKTVIDAYKRLACLYDSLENVLRTHGHVAALCVAKNVCRPGRATLKGDKR